MEETKEHQEAAFWLGHRSCKKSLFLHEYKLPMLSWDVLRAHRKTYFYTCFVNVLVTPVSVSIILKHPFWRLTEEGQVLNAESMGPKPI